MEPQSFPEDLIEKLRLTVSRALYRFGYGRSRWLLCASGEYRELVAGVADEALALARTRIDRYDPQRGPFSYWVFLLGRKLLVREFEQMERYRRAFQDAAAEAGPPLEPSGSDDFASILERDRLGRALAEIPKRQAQVLGLFYLAGLSLQEIADLTASSPESVSSLLQRARHNARQRLEGKPQARRGRPRKAGVPGGQQAHPQA